MASQLSLVWCEVCQRPLHSAESRDRGRGPVCDARLHPRRARVPRPRRPAYAGPDLLDLLKESL